MSEASVANFRLGRSESGTLPYPLTSSRLEVGPFTDESDGLCEGTGTDAASALDDASFTPDVLREVED